MNTKILALAALFMLSLLLALAGCQDQERPAVVEAPLVTHTPQPDVYSAAHAYTLSDVYSAAHAYTLSDNLTCSHGRG